MNSEDTSEQEDSDIELYGDPRIASKDAPIPGWLKCSYLVWPIVGLLWFYFFWNGSYGWLDRGYWQQLQRAANTTFPFDTSEIVEKQAVERRLKTSSPE